MQDQTPVRFLNNMFDGEDRVAILAIPRADPDARVEQRFTPAKVAGGRTQAWLRHLNAKRYDIYLGVNPIRTDSTQREKGDIADVRRLQVDLDDNGPENLKRLLGDVNRGTIPQPRHLLRSSKDHYQVLWDTARGQWSPDQAEATMRGLAARYGGDPACSEVARVMRWPGYRNQKEGRAREMVGWIDRGGKPVSPDDFRALPAPEMRTAREAPLAPGRGRPATQVRPNRISQSEKDWAWVKDQLKAGTPPLQVQRELAQRRSDKPKPDAYAALTVDKAMRAVANETHHHEREITR
ncbi:MAG: DNA-primase RepB domain-containing protein [Acidobacteriota bacterium]|nr:DNA-primase RepB domain-containing protein [Acidobacteriota bacterium]